MFLYATFEILSLCNTDADFSVFLRISANLPPFILKASFITIEDNQSAEVLAGTVLIDVEYGNS